MVLYEVIKNLVQRWEDCRPPVQATHQPLTVTVQEYQILKQYLELLEQEKEL